ncbi:carbon-nitrogen hydrolase family protein [Spongiibacter sp.]|uniref:carbon-nitrogen hydrolase family protein n=1 Tax=Spongiibacter sp. TaxID=2024860 RepID=UPI003565468E
MKVCVSAIQMVSGGDVRANLKRAQLLLEEAALAGAQLAVLPENFALFAPAAELRSRAEVEQKQGELHQFIAEQARRLGVWLVGGTLPWPADDGRCYAESPVYSSDGERVAQYRKIHLFDADIGDAQQSYRESLSYAPGHAPVVFDSPWGRVGVAVCYDLRFPELFRAMLDQGVEIVALPAAFTRRTGLAHWLPLLRARAIENQIAVVAANQGGVHSRRRETSGGSCVIDSWGTVLRELGFGEGQACATVDMAAQQRLRERMPVARHRRF